MKIEGILTKKINVEIDPIDFINELSLKYFKYQLEDIIVKDDGLYFEYDISMHGSPVIEHELITNKSDLIEIYHHLIKLKQLMINDK